MGRLRKGFVTYGTNKSFFSCVCSTVRFQVSRVGKIFVTWQAGKELFSGMSSYILFQARRGREGLVTQGAGVLCVSVVCFYMVPQASLDGKSLFTRFCVYFRYRYEKRRKISMGGLALMVISPKKWQILPVFMSTLWIIQLHLKSSNYFIWTYW